MTNSLDITTSSFLTSASSASTGGSKADQTDANAIDGQFSGLLNQALQGQSSGAQQTDHHHSPKNSTNETQQTPKDDKAEPAAADQKTARAEHPDESKNAPHKKTEKPDPSEIQANVQDAPALTVAPQPQPLDLTLLHAATLLGPVNQNPTTDVENNGTDTSGETAISAATPGNPSALPQIASQLALIPGLLKGQQNNLAFALPGPTQANALPGSEDPQAPTTTTETNLQPILDGANGIAVPPDLQVSSAPNTSPLPLPTQASSEGLMGKGAQGPLEGLSAGLNLNPVGSNNNSPKPNASLPSSDTFKKSLTSIQDSLNELHGTIEESPEPSGKALKETTTSDSSAPSTDSSTLSASDLLTATGLGSATPTTHGTHDSGANGIPQFSSLAQNPVDQVADGTAYSVNNGQRELIIRLNPNNLGEVRVNLISHGNQELSARLIASTPESHDLLKSQLNSLRSNLEAQGVTVDRISVVLAGSAEAGGTGNQTSHQQSTQHQESQQQQQTQQQGAFQQQFNQQNPNSNAMFNLMNGQSQSQPNFAAQRFNSPANGTETDTDGAWNPTPPAASNDNGRISLLA